MQVSALGSIRSFITGSVGRLFSPIWRLKEVVVLSSVLAGTVASVYFIVRQVFSFGNHSKGTPSPLKDRVTQLHPKPTTSAPSQAPPTPSRIPRRVGHHGSPPNQSSRRPAADDSDHSNTATRLADELNIAITESPQPTPNSAPSSSKKKNRGAPPRHDARTSTSTLDSSERSARPSATPLGPNDTGLTLSTLSPSPPPPREQNSPHAQNTVVSGGGAASAAATPTTVSDSPVGSVEALRSPCSGNTREAEEPAPTKMPSNQRRRLRKGLFSPLSSAASEDFTPLSSENESSSHPPAALTSSHAPGASAHGAAASVAADSSHNDSEEEDESSRARSPTARPSFHLPASLSQGAASSHSKEEESSSPPSPPPLAPYHAPTASVDRATALFSSPSPSNPSEEEEASSTPQPSLNGAAAASATAIALHPVSNGEGSLLALSSEEASSSDPDGEEPSSSPSVLPLASHAPASFAHAAAASAAANSSEPEPEEEEDEESSLPSNSPVPSRAPMTTPRTSTQPDVSDQESSRAPSPAISARLAAAARSSSGAAAASFQPIPQQSPAKPKVLEKTSVLKDHVPIYTGTFRFENPVNLDNPAMPASNITLKIPRFLKIYRERSDKPGYDKITDLNTLATELSKLGWHTQKDKVLFLLTLPDLGEQLVRSALASKETKKYPNMLFPAGNSWVIDKEKMKFFVPNTRTSRKILLTNIFCKKNERSIQFSFFFDQDFNVWTSFAVWQRGVHPLETFPDLSPALTRIIKSSHSPAGFCSLLTGEVSFDYPLQDLINQKSTVFQQNAQRCSPSWTSLIEEEWSGAEVDDICRLLSEQEPWKRLKDLLLRKMNDAGQPHDQPWDVSQCRVIWTQKKPKIFFLKDSSGRKTILIRNVFFMKEPRLVQYCFLLTPIAGGKTFQVRALHTVWARSAHPIDALSLFPMGSTANLHEAASAESDV